MLDFSKLSPGNKFLLLRNLQDDAIKALRYLNEDIKNWEEDGSIKTEAGQEMIGWRDALNDLLMQINKEQKDAK